MAFVKKEWKDRLTEFAGRRVLKDINTQESKTYDVSRAEGQVSQEGDAFSAANMNNLETRISNAITATDNTVATLNKNLGGVKFGVTADGQPGYKKDGADTVIPFKGTPEYIATVELVYSGEPSQRHNLTVSAAMAKYKTLIISCTGNVGVRDTDTVEISSGNGKVLSVQKISELMVAIVENASINTVISFIHYGTGLATAIVYGL